MEGTGNVVLYMESLPKVTLDRLYSQPATCLAVLRLQPDATKHTILRLLYVRTPFAESVLNAWALPGHSRFSSLARSTIVVHLLSNVRRLTLSPITA
eukprot:jgi/Hompol1/2750/HPOL_000639-RA